MCVIESYTHFFISFDFVLLIEEYLYGKKSNILYVSFSNIPYLDFSIRTCWNGHNNSFN